MAMDLAALQARVEQLGLRWTPGVTSQSDHTALQARNRLGAEPPTGTPSLADRERRVALRQLAPAAPSVPPALDWRNRPNGDFVTPIEDQGGCGSCVAFGAIAVLESMVRIAAQDATLAVDLSEAQLFFCWGPSHGAGACPGGGWWPDDAFAGMQQGIVDASCFPYTDADQPCNLCANWQSRLTTFTSSTTVSTIAGMKAFISSVGPMSACFTVYEDFYYHYTSGVYTYNAATSGNVIGGHCVAIVGYDDTQQCWIAKNQWGTGWGENGYFRISYGSCGIDSEMWGIDGVISSPLITDSLQVTGVVNGNLWHTARNPNGSWFPKFGLIEGQEQNNPGAFTGVSCTGGSTGGSTGGGEVLQVVGVVNGNLWHTTRNPDGTWQPTFGLIEGQEHNNPGAFTDVSCTGTSSGAGNALHIIGVVNGNLWHTTRNADGTWQPTFGLIEGQEHNNPGAFTEVSCTGVGQILHVVGVVNGNLWHTTRNADGTWQPTFGLIEGQEHNNPGAFTDVSCTASSNGSTGAGDALHVVGVVNGNLWHTTRNADGTWQPTFGLIEGQEQNNPGAFTDVSCASEGDVLHVVGVVNGNLWHTTRNGDGSWYPQFGLIEGQEQNNPGAFIDVSCG